jgi:sec-independent protein translocase protein TatB
MFDFFSSQHIIILLVVLLVVVGPKDLPRLMHMVGQWAGKARNMANEFKKSFDDMARQEELTKLRAELEEMRKTSFDVPSVKEIEAAANGPSVSIGPEPRSGEFQINEAAVSPSATAPHVPEPAVANVSGSEPPPA